MYLTHYQDYQEAHVANAHGNPLDLHNRKLTFHPCYSVPAANQEVTPPSEWESP